MECARPELFFLSQLGLHGGMSDDMPPFFHIPLFRLLPFARRTLAVQSPPWIREAITRPQALNAPPHYLTRHYWWAYVHPFAVRLFERQWLVNLILWGNFSLLRDLALNALGLDLPGRSLQIACVYGDLTPRLLERVRHSGGSLDVVDVLPVQLSNLAAKLPENHGANLLHQDASNLSLPDAAYDRALLFFLLHEQPPHVRRRSLEEAWRVVKPGGTLVVVDYARPHWWNPLRYLWLPVLERLEPFAADLWNNSLPDLLPPPYQAAHSQTRRLFGGLYQLWTFTRSD